MKFITQVMITIKEGVQISMQEPTVLCQLSDNFLRLKQVYVGHMWFSHITSILPE